MGHGLISAINFQAYIDIEYYYDENGKYREIKREGFPFNVYETYDRQTTLRRFYIFKI